MQKAKKEKGIAHLSHSLACLFGLFAQKAFSVCAIENIIMPCHHGAELFHSVPIKVSTQIVNCAFLEDLSFSSSYYTACLEQRGS